MNKLILALAAALMASLLPASTRAAGIIGGGINTTAFVQANCGQVNAPGGTVTVSLAAPPQINDLVIVFLENNGSATGGADTYTPPAQYGFTAIDADAAANNTHLNEFSYAQVVDPGDLGVYAFTPTDGTRQHVWCVAEYDGVSLATPYSIHGLQYGGAAGSSWSGQTLFPDLLPSVYVSFFGVTGTDSATWTNPDGFNQRAYNSKWSTQLIDTNGDSLNSRAITSTSSVSLAGPGEVDTIILRPSNGLIVTAPPGYQQGACDDTDNPTVLNVVFNTAPAQGDLIVVFAENNGLAAGGAITYVQPAGFTLLDSDAAVNNNFLDAFSWYKVAGASEPTTYGFTPSSNTRHHVWCWGEYTGQSALTPIDQHQMVYNGSTQTTWSTAILTATSQQETPVAFMAPLGSASATWTNAVGWAQRAFDNIVWMGQLIEGPQTSTAGQSVSETSTLSAAHGPGDVDLILLSSQFIPPPSPTASPSPPPQSPYTYHGCSIYVPNDWLTTDLTVGGSSYATNTVDSHSSAIITNLNNTYGGYHFDGGGGVAHVANLEAENVATNATQTFSAGLANDPFGDNPNGVIPWVNGFKQEGNQGCTGSSGDCHGMVLNTSNPSACVEYEAYHFNGALWNGSTFLNPASGYTHNMGHSLNTQYSSDSSKIDAAGIPLIGTTDFGEDASLPSINHPIGLIWAGPSSGTHGVGGYTPPATSAEGCGTNCTHMLPYGARLRLHASYTCPTSTQAALVCNQLKHYGMILQDTLSQTPNHALRWGLSSNGTNPWNASDLDNLLNTLQITDFDVMTMNSCTNCNL